TPEVGADLQQIINIHKGVAYIYKDKDNREFIRTPPHGEGKGVHKYDKIKQTYVFKNELYYVAREGDREFVVRPDGKEGPGLEEINWIGSVNDELVYEGKW